jgi:methyl-accepting chemotaxis protein
MTQSLNAMLDQDDPIVAFVETWALCVRFRMYLDEGEGASLYGEGQAIAVSAAARLEAETERIGHVFLKDDVFDAASTNVKEFANTNPIKGTFSNVMVFATGARKGQANPFVSVLKIPITPFRAIEGVDRTASAVHRFTDTAERFSDIVRELPESTRWQLQLLLYDLEETEMTKAFLSALTQFSQSSERLSKSVEQMPKQFGEQFEKSVEQLDARQANLQKTLEQAEKTAGTVSETIKELNKTTETLNTAAKDITLTANAWETAARTIGEVLKEYNKIGASSTGKASFDIKEYRLAAEQTSQAANDIQGLLSAVDGFSKARYYSGFINAITLRAMGFVVLVFVLAVIYRIISARLMKVWVPNAATKKTKQRVQER